MKWRKGQAALEYMMVMGGMLMVTAIAMKYSLNAMKSLSQTTRQGVETVTNKVMSVL